MLSAPQIKTLNGRLWPAACRAQGWPRNDREAVAQGWAGERDFRLQTLGEIVGRTLTSSSDLGKVDEFTQVKNRLLRLADNLTGAAEDGDPVPNELRTRRWCALRDIQCLLLYVDEAYVRSILRDRFARAGTCVTRFDELTLEQLVAEFKTKAGLDELLATLNERLHAKGRKAANGTWRRQPGKRVEAGHTLHEMRTLAGVQCDCKDCAGPRARVVLPAEQEAAADYQPEEQPF